MVTGITAVKIGDSHEKSKGNVTKRLSQSKDADSPRLLSVLTFDCLRLCILFDIPYEKLGYPTFGVIIVSINSTTSLSSKI